MENNNLTKYVLFFLLGVLISSLFYYGPAVIGRVYNTPEGKTSSINRSVVDFSPSEVRSVSVPIVAVNQYDNSGVTGNLTVKIIPGDNTVLIATNPFIEPDLQYSANIAVGAAKAAANYTGEKDYIFSYGIDSNVVGGGSAGAIATIAVIAALENRNINKDVIMTGTINPDGSIGEVGGILEKAKAAADAGYKIFLVPKGQSVVRYYEKVLNRDTTRGGFVFYNTRYVPKTIDLKDTAEKEWGLKVIEVSNINEAEKYMLQ